MERRGKGNQKGKIFVVPESLELRVINPLSLFNIVFQKFTHTHTQIRTGQGPPKGTGRGPLSSQDWEVLILGFPSARLPRNKMGGMEYLQRMGAFLLGEAS